MKRIALVMVVILIASIIAGAASATVESNIEVTGSVVSVAHQNDATQAVRFKLSLGDDSTVLPLVKVIVTGELANQWDKKLKPGMVVTVRGRARVSNDPGVALIIDALGIE